MQCIEPAPGLTHIFDDEVSGEVTVEPLLVLKRVVNLSKRHGTGLEPAVKDLWDPSHGRLAGWVVRVRPG